MTSGTAAWQLSSALAGCVAEQITVGALLSVTVKVVVLGALQLSLTLAPPMTLGTGAWQLSSALAFFFNDPATAEIFSLALHDALPILALFPAASVAVTVIVWVPRPTSVPGAGD